MRTGFELPSSLQLTRLRRHRAFLILITFAAVLFLNDIWIYKEFVRSESYFALGARLMVERNEWLAPHAPDERQLNKPPFTYWLIGISYMLFGPNYGSARLPSVICAIVILIIVYILGIRLDGIRAGLISAAILGSSFLFLSFARLAMSDMLLTLCVTTALACFIVAMNEQTPVSRRIAMAGYVSLAFGVLTKGPVAFALVAAPIILAIALLRDGARIRQLHLLSGSILFVLIAAPYFLLVYLHLGTEPLRFFFLGENIQRFTGGVYGTNARPFWYQLASFFSEFAPWSLLLFIAVWFDWRLRERDEPKQSGRLVLYLWLGFTILLFSLSSFKLDYYLLPAMPAAALIIGPVIANAHNLPSLARRLIEKFLILSALVIFAVALLSLKVAAALSVVGSSRLLPPAAAVVGLTGIFVYLSRQRFREAALMLTATIWAVFLTMQWTLLPAFAHYLPATQLVGSAPADRVWYTSWAASDWANCLAFNLPPPHTVERLIGDANNEKLRTVLRSDQRAVVVVWESEFLSLQKETGDWKVLAQADTFPHGGLTLNLLRNPRRERLLLIGH